MNTKAKLSCITAIIAMLSVVVLFTVHASRAGIETKKQASNGTKKMTIRVNGISSFAILADENTNTNGFINVGRDQIANTTQLDFSYATPDTVDPEIVYFIHGMGDIPNGAFTVDLSSAHLAVTTAFPVDSCVVNIVTSDFDCENGSPITFNLAWARDGFGSINEKIQQRQTMGPLTVKFKGEYESVTAAVNGTWTGHTGTNQFGNLFDNKNSTSLREITMETNH